MYVNSERNQVFFSPFEILVLPLDLFFLTMESQTDPIESTLLIVPAPIREPNDDIDLEAGPEEQIQCRICLETDGEIIVSFFLVLFGYTDCCSFEI